MLAAPVGRTLSIGELPFHYFVDAEGDQIALPCTERFVDADTAARLHRLGIVALMAHKGQPELRFAGLDAVNGQAIALQGMPKPAVRSTVTTAVQSRLKDIAAPPAAAAASASVDGEDDAAPSEDGGLDDLLAGLGADDADSASSEAGAGDDAPADEPAGDAGAEPEMDPELAALLKSLE